MLDSGDERFLIVGTDSEVKRRNSAESGRVGGRQCMIVRIRAIFGENLTTCVQNSP